MKFYQYPKCGTCRKAVKFFKENDLSVQSIDITEQPPTVDELKLMLAVYQGEIRKLFNTSGMQYRELDMKNKLPTMTNEQAVDLLSKNGKLIKRPFLILENPIPENNDSRSGLVGFNEAQWQDFFSKLK